ncbi:MAG: ferrous iron transport protein A [Candidatus Thorarchaeota archaeon]
MDSKYNHHFPNPHKKNPIFKNLVEFVNGKKFIVQTVNTGYHAKRRLSCLGIIPGVEIIKKKAAPFRGPIEIIVMGSSLVIGRGLASKIIVK